MRTFSPRDLGKVKIKFEDAAPPLRKPPVTGPTDPLQGLEARLAKAEAALGQSQKIDPAGLIAPLVKELKEVAAALMAVAKAEAKPEDTKKEAWEFEVVRGDDGRVKKYRARQL